MTFFARCGLRISVSGFFAGFWIAFALSAATAGTQIADGPDSRTPERSGTNGQRDTDSSTEPPVAGLAVAPVMELTAEVELRPFEFPGLPPGGLLGGSCHLGEVQAGHDCRVTVTLRNISSRELQFTGSSSTCACISFSTQSQGLAPGTASEGTARFRCPTGSPDGKFAIVVELVDGEKAVARIGFQGDIANSLHMAPNAFFRLGDKGGSWKIPVQMTEPVNLSSLSVEKAKSLEDVQFQLRQDNNQVFVEVLAEPDSISSDFANGLIRLSSTTGPSCTCDLIVARRQPLTISPRVLAFRKVDDDPAWKANMLVHFDRELVPIAELETLQIELAANSSVTEFHAITLAPGIVRVTVSLTPEFLQEAGNPESIECTFRTATRRFSESVSFLPLEQ